MICVICHTPKGNRVFTGSELQLRNNHISFKNLAGVCLDCYFTIPKHIPFEQARKFLESRKIK
jgi:hypothetical protein